MNRLAIVGCGRLGNIVAGAVANGFLPEYELVVKRLPGWRLNFPEAVPPAGLCLNFLTLNRTILWRRPLLRLCVSWPYLLWRKGSR